MIQTEPTVSNNLIQPKSYEDLVGRRYSGSDYGFVGSNIANIQNTWSHGLTQAAADFINYHFFKDDDVAVTDDVFNNSYASQLGLEQKEGETEAQLDFRIRKAASQRAYSLQAQGQDRSISNFVGSLGTGFVDPANVLLMLASGGSGGIAGISRASFASSRLAAQAGKPLIAAAHSAKGQLQNYAALSVGTEFAYAKAIDSVGVNDYTGQMAANHAMGFVAFGGLMTGINVPRNYRNFSKVRTYQRQARDYRRAMDGTYKEMVFPVDPNVKPIIRKEAGGFKVLEVFQTISDYATPHVRALINSNPRLKAIAEKKISANKITDADVKDMGKILAEQETHVLLVELNKALAKQYRAKDGSVVKNELEFRTQMARIQKAILEGNDAGLTKADISFLERQGLNLKSKRARQNRAERNVTPDVGYVPGIATDLDAYSRVPSSREEFKATVAQARLIKGQEEEYKFIVQDVNSLINQIFVGEQAVPVKVEDFKLEQALLNPTKTQQGKVTFGKLGIQITDVYTMFEGAQPDLGGLGAGKIITTNVHELFHQLQDLQPKVYEDLENFIVKNPELNDILIKEIKRVGYLEDNAFAFDLEKFPWVEYIYKDRIAVIGDTGYVSTVEVEKVPLLMEWYVTRQEFYDNLKKQKPNLYQKFIALLKGLFEKIAESLRIKRPEFSEEINNLNKSQNIAKSVQSILQGMKNDASFQGRLAKLQQGITNSENLTAASYYKATYKPSYENPNLAGRVSELERQNANTIKYLEERIADLVGDETVVPMLLNLPKQSLGEAGRRDYIASLVSSLEEKGLGHIVPVVDVILRNLQGSASRKASVIKALRKNTTISNTEALNALFEKNAPPEVLSRVGSILLNNNLSKTEKIGKVSEYLSEEDRAMVVRLIHNKTVQSELNAKLDSIKTKQNKVKQFKTLLDGSLRSDVKLEASVHKQINAQVVKDQSPIIEYLVNKDLLEVFLGEDPSKYMSSYFNKYFPSENSKKAYGENLEKASVVFHQAIMEAIRDGKPFILENIDDFKGLVDVIKTITRGQLAEINRLGVNIRESKTFTGYSIKYDPLVVKSMGQKGFYDYMINVIDASKTSQLHGGVMFATDVAGTKTVVDFEINGFIKNLYLAIINNKFDLEDAATQNKSIAGGLRKSSKIAYKPEHQIDALTKFSNFKNLGRLLLDQIRNRSEKIALIKSLGHDPYNTLMSVVADQQLQSTPGIKTFNMTAKQITGMLDNPVDVNIARNFQKVRQASNILYLAGSGMSAMSDVPLMISTLQYLNADFNFSTFINSYKNAINTQFRGKNKEMAAWYRAQGAGFDLLTRTIAQKVVTGESIDGGKMGFANQLVFEINGLNRITATHQQITIDIISLSLADAVTKGANKVLLERLKSYQFTDAEIKRLAKHVETTVDGINRLAPSSVTNAKLQAKLSAFYLQYMKEAVIEPDVGAQALSRLGLEAGTYSGEAARTAFQYSSFMLGMARVVYRRFLNGYTGDAKHNAFKMSHLITYIGMAIAFAYLTTIMKDLSKAKEPINPLDMTKFDFLRILKQSGLLTIGELGVDAAIFGPEELFSPVVGQGYDLLSGDFDKAFKPFTGQQYPVLGPVLEQAVGFVAGETMLNIQQDMLDRVDEPQKRF